MPYMGWSCSVCSDGLHKDVTGEDIPAAQFRGANIMVTPCGHAFHSYCITRWMTGLAGPHGTCPNCRKTIPKKVCTATYPDTYEVTLSESDIMATPTSSSTQDNKQELNELRKLLLEEKKKTTSLTTQLSEEKSLSTTFSAEAAMFEAKFQKEKQSAENYRAKYEVTKSFETLAGEQDKDLKRLKLELSKYSWIQDQIAQHKAEVASEMETMSFDPDHFRAIIECNKLLQRELQATSAKVQAEKKNQEDNIKLISSLKKENTLLKKDKTELKAVVNDLNQQLAAQKGITPATATPKLATSSNQLKRNLKALEELDRTIDLSSDDEKKEDRPKKLKKLQLEDSVVLTKRTRARTGLSSKIRELSPLKMQIKSNVPGVGPITPTVSSARPSPKKVLGSARHLGSIRTSRVGAIGLKTKSFAITKK